jgi:hypothetical protein
MKNIEITHDCFVKGEPVAAGDILKDVDNGVAAELLVSGRAKLAKLKNEAPAVKKVAKKASKKVAKKDAKPDSK